MTHDVSERVDEHAGVEALQLRLTIVVDRERTCSVSACVIVSESLIYQYVIV